MSGVQWSLLVASSYVVGFFVARKIQRDNAAAGVNTDPVETFMFWLLSPLMVALYTIVTIGARIPPFMFPVPQVQKVRERLEEATETEEQQ